MALSFRYKKVKRENNQDVKSPSIPVVLSGSGGKYEFFALVDSGADVSVIPQEIAELLGLDLSGEREEARGIGGKVIVIQSKMNLEIKRGHEAYSLTLPVNYSGLKP